MIQSPRRGQRSICSKGPSILGLWYVFIVPLGCTERPEEPRSRTFAQGLAQTLSTFDEAVQSGAVLGATSALYVGDRARIEALSGFAAVGNTGTQITRLGTDAKVGPIWSAAPVDLRDRATVYGAVHAASVTQGNQVVIQGGIIGGSLGGTAEAYNVPTGLPVIGTSVSLEPGQQATLQPGSYQALVVKSQASLHLDAGAYSFSTVQIESGAKIYTKSDCEPVALEARNSFTFRGVTIEEGGDDPGLGLTIYYSGTGTAHVEAPFRGTILAPKAELILSSATHRGRFFAKTLRLQANAVVKDAAPRPLVAGECGYALPSLAVPTPVAVDIGSAPPLSDDDDLQEFLDWYFLITAAEKPQAEARIHTVTPNSGIRQGVIARFEAARSARDIGPALMLLAMLGALPDPAVETYLLGLLGQAISGGPDPEGESSTAYDFEVEYRRQVLFILTALQTPAASAAVHDTALNHAIGTVRSAAIWALSHGKSAAEIDALRDEIRAEDEFYLDLPTRSDGDFDEKLNEFGDTYAN